MSASKVLVATAALLVLLTAGADAQIQTTRAILEVRGGETYVDSAFLSIGMAQPRLFVFRDFGGNPGTLDTAVLGELPGWPRHISTYWRFDGSPQPPLEIPDPVNGQWYEFPPGGSGSPRIQFAHPGAVAEPEARPVPARVTAAPNPFSHRTRLGVRLAQPGRTVVELYDAAGRPVRSLADAELEPGNHDWTWDGADDDGNRLAAGIYLVRLVTDDSATIHKLILTD